MILGIRKTNWIFTHAFILHSLYIQDKCYGPAAAPPNCWSQQYDKHSSPPILGNIRVPSWPYYQSPGCTDCWVGLTQAYLGWPHELLKWLSLFSGSIRRRDKNSILLVKLVHPTLSVAEPDSCKPFHCEIVLSSESPSPAAVRTPYYRIKLGFWSTYTACFRAHPGYRNCLPLPMQAQNLQHHYKMPLPTPPRRSIEYSEFCGNP